MLPSIKVGLKICGTYISTDIMFGELTHTNKLVDTQ